MENIKDLLKNNNLKVTKARVAILEILNSEYDHLNADGIFKIINKQKNIKINFATVYRTLSSLLKCGKLKKVNLGKETDYFELIDKKHHHHIVCKLCDTIENFDLCEIKKIEKKVLSKSNKFSKIQDHSLEFFGICNKCKKF